MKITKNDFNSKLEELLSSKCEILCYNGGVFAGEEVVNIDCVKIHRSIRVAGSRYSCEVKNRKVEIDQKVLKFGFDLLKNKYHTRLTKFINNYFIPKK